MRVRELRKILENVPDDAVILIPSRDHKYRIGRADFEEVELTLDGEFQEYYDEYNMSEGGEIRKHLIIS